MLELMLPFYFLTFAKVSVSVSKKFGLKKVSVSVSKRFGLKKKSLYRSRKFWSRKKVSVSVLMKFFGLVTQCGRVEIKSLQLINFNTGRVNSEKKLLHCNYSPQWVFKCVLRQLVKIDLKSDMAIAFTSARRTSWSLSRTTGEESQLWMIRTQLGLWKRVPLKQKKILGLCKLRTCLDLMIPNRQWRHDR